LKTTIELKADVDRLRTPGKEATTQRIRIVNNSGGVLGTRVLLNDVEVRYVRKVEFEHDANGVATVKLEIFCMDGIDIDVDALAAVSFLAMNPCQCQENGLVPDESR
jgi:hypothetical protein